MDTSLPLSLELDRVSYSYSHETTLRDVTLRVRRGERVGLLGPNGAGKSTLLKIASGILSPNSGRVVVQGDAIGHLNRAEVARRVAMVPQSFSVQFAYTVREIVAMGRLPHLGSWGIPRPADRRAVDMAIGATNLEAFADRTFSSLSGGEQQRVLLALALAQESPIILLDEPTAHLDLRHQIATLDLMREINERLGITILSVMHDLQLAARAFPRLVLLDRGIVADGTPSEVLDSVRLREVYQTSVRVGIMRGDEHMSVVPQMSSEMLRTPGEKTAIAHVCSSGGSGGVLIRALVDRQVPFSAGSFAEGESDLVLARRWSQSWIAEPPASPFSTEGITTLRHMLASVAIIYLCPMAISAGNIAILEAIYDAARAGTSVILLDDPAYEWWLADDIRPRAEAILAKLVALGAQRTASLSEALSLIEDAQAVKLRVAAK